jgi:hypothetical protein
LTQGRVARGHNGVNKIIDWYSFERLEHVRAVYLSFGTFLRKFFASKLATQKACAALQVMADVFPEYLRALLSNPAFDTIRDDYENVIRWIQT